MGLGLPSLPAGLRSCCPHPPALREMLLKCKSDQVAPRLKTLQGLPLCLKSNPTPCPTSSPWPWPPSLTSPGSASFPTLAVSGLLAFLPTCQEQSRVRDFELEVSSAWILPQLHLPFLLGSILVKRARRCLPCHPSNCPLPAVSLSRNTSEPSFRVRLSFVILFGHLLVHHLMPH